VLEEQAPAKVDSSHRGGAWRVVAAHWRALAVLVAALLVAWRYAVFLDPFAPVRDWLAWRLLAIWGYSLFFGAACLAAGQLVLSRALRLRELPVLESAALAVPLGLVVFVLGQYALGALRLFHAAPAILLPAGMLVAGARPLAAWGKAALASARPPPSGALERAVLGLATLFGLVGVAFVYLGAFTPDAINYDASWCHLTIAEDWARAGRLVPFPGDYARAMPHLKHLVDTWAFVVPGLGPTTRLMLVLHLEIGVFLCTLAGIAATTRYLLGDRDVRGTWAAFFLFPGIFVYDSNLGGAADHYLALFAAPLFLALMRGFDRRERAWFVLAGMLAGGALLTKYQAVYLVFGVGLVVVGRWLAALVAAVGARRAGGSERRQALRELALDPALLVGVGLLVAAPHFIANWSFHRNPVYPFAQDLFRASSPTTPDAALLFESLFKDWRFRPHGTLAANALESLRLALELPFKPSYSFIGNYPTTGALFTLTLPLVLFVRGRRRLVFAAIASYGAAFAWAMTFRVDRHLQTFLPLVVAATAAVIVRALELGWLARAGVVPLVLLQVLWGGDALALSSHERIRSALDMIRERSAAKRYASRKEYRAIGASLPRDAKLLLHQYRTSLGIDRDVVMDAPGQQALVRYDTPGGPRAFYDELRAVGVTHLLYLPHKSPSLSKQEEILFAELAHRFAGPRSRFGEIEVVALPAAAPPPDAPYVALALGLPGYKSGLYPLAAMGVLETLPGHTVAFPPPSVPWPAGEAEQRALALRADAVVLAERAPVSPGAMDAIKARFEVAESFPAFSVHLRKR
jgi:hypothetical protein